VRFSGDFLLTLSKTLTKKQYLGLMYKPAKIFDNGGDLKGTWYVYFYYRTDTAAKFKRFRVTADINRIHTLPGRRAAAEVLQRLINHALENGYDPTAENAKETGLFTGTSLLQSIKDTFSVKQNSLKKISGKTYETHVKKFINWLTNEGMTGLQAQDFSPPMPPFISTT